MENKRCASLFQSMLFGGGPSGGGGGEFLITITYDGEGYSVDKTAEQLISAIESGKTIYIRDEGINQTYLSTARDYTEGDTVAVHATNVHINSATSVYVTKYTVRWEYSKLNWEPFIEVSGAAIS